MILNKKELIERLINGEKLTPSSCSNTTYCYYDESYINPFRYVNVEDNSNDNMQIAWSITEWREYKEQSEWWEPEDGEKAYYIKVTGDITKSNSWRTLVDNMCIKQGNVFKTKEEAEKESALRAAKYRVKRRIWELNGGKFLEFNPNINNYTFVLGRDNEMHSTWFTNKICPNWQLLKSEKLVEQLIEEIHEDLLLIRSE